VPILYHEDRHSCKLIKPPTQKKLSAHRLHQFKINVVHVLLKMVKSTDRASLTRGAGAYLALLKQDMVALGAAAFILVVNFKSQISFFWR
jgi:hypothetical protein